METSQTHTVEYKKLTTRDELANLNEVFRIVFESERDQSEDNFLAILADERVYPLGAFVADQLVGGLVAYELVLLSGVREFYIYDIAVLLQFQKQGIGRGLMQMLVEEAKARGVTTVFVEAEADDEGAVAFYRACEGEEISVAHFNFKVDAL